MQSASAKPACVLDLIGMNVELLGQLGVVSHPGLQFTGRNSPGSLTGERSGTVT